MIDPKMRFVDPAAISEEMYRDAICAKPRTLEDGCVMAVKAVERRLDILRSAGYAEAANWLERVVFEEGAQLLPGLFPNYADRNVVPA